MLVSLLHMKISARDISQQKTSRLSSELGTKQPLSHTISFPPLPSGHVVHVNPSIPLIVEPLSLLLKCINYLSVWESSALSFQFLSPSSLWSCVSHHDGAGLTSLWNPQPREALFFLANTMEESSVVLPSSEASRSYCKGADVSALKNTRKLPCYKGHAHRV